MGCDKVDTTSRKSFVPVSIHAPAWGATIPAVWCGYLCSVSIHAPAWGATLRTVDTTDFRGGFNPRTRVGCDVFQQSYGMHFQTVSIHAPAWGATQCPDYMGGKFAKFQSTHPRGVRLDYFFLPLASPFVSIHAPAWGATGCKACKSSHVGRFNPRTRVGCDGSHITRTVLHRGFNPRTRVGCDAKKRLESCITAVSIHAPAWGATWNRMGLISHERVSIHAPAWGATCRGRAWRPAGFRFNPRTRVGCDQ